MKAISWLSFMNEICIKHQEVQQNIARVSKYSWWVSRFTWAHFRIDHIQAHQYTHSHQTAGPAKHLALSAAKTNQEAPEGPGSTKSGHIWKRAASPQGDGKLSALPCSTSDSTRQRRPPSRPTDRPGPDQPTRLSAAAPRTDRRCPASFSEERKKTLIYTLVLGLVGFFLSPAGISIIFSTDWLAKFSKHRARPSGTQNRRTVGHLHCICLVRLSVSCNYFNVNNFFPIFRQEFLLSWFLRRKWLHCVHLLLCSFSIHFTPWYTAEQLVQFVIKFSQTKLWYKNPTFIQVDADHLAAQSSRSVST